MRRASVGYVPYFALTYALSWAIWLPLLWLHFNPGAWPQLEGLSAPLRLLGVLMPATAALVLTARAGGWRGVQALLGGLTRWRVGLGSWAAAALVQPALVVTVALLYNALGGAPAVTAAPALPAAWLAAQVVFLTLASLGEEIGWRGVALPAMQARSGPLKASVWLGLLWATWHLPFWLLIGNLEQFGWGYFALNYLFIVPTSVYLTWVFNRSRGSLLLAVVFHVTFNLINVLWLPVTSSMGAFAWLLAAEWVVAFALLRYLSPQPGPAAAQAGVRPI
jgi:uncharacterized protein